MLAPRGPVDQLVPTDEGHKTWKQTDWSYPGEPADDV